MAHEHKPGFMKKLKEKLPGHHNMPDLSEDPEETVPRVSSEAVSAGTGTAGTDTKAVTPRVEKKGVVQKIKDRLSGQHHDKENSGPDVPETPTTHSDEYQVKEANIDDNNGPGYGIRKARTKKHGMTRNNSF